MNSLVSQPQSEPFFQAVIVIEKEDGRLFPLTEDAPKCLLPVAGKPILIYQLDLLEKSGVNEVLLAGPAEYATTMAAFLGDYRGSVRVEFVPVATMLGELDCLRAVADRIRKDVIVIGTDVITECVLPQLTELHRLRACDVTMLLKEDLAEDAADKNRKVRRKRDEEDVDFVGISAEGRVLIKQAMGEVEELPVLKPLLRKVGGLAVRTDLLDVRVYCLAKWVFDFAVRNTRMTALRGELLPFLVQRQFQPLEFMQEHFPEMANPHRALPVVDEYVVPPDDYLRCFAVVVPAAGPFCTRVSTLADLLQVDKEILSHPVTAITPWTAPQNYLKKEQSIVGEDTSIGDKVLMKNCSIGNHSRIGERCKINNCLIMNNVQIGNNCVLQNCVISHNCVIEDNCNLNECQLAPDARVAAGQRLKGEAITRAH